MLIQSSEFLQNFIDLQNIDFASVQQVNIINANFYQYLVKVNQILKFELEYVYAQQIVVNQASLFNLKNIDSGTWKSIHFKEIYTDLQQITVFQIELEYEQNSNQISFTNIIANLQSDNNIQLLTLNGFIYNFYMIYSHIRNGSSINFGGCLNFINTFQASQEQNIKIENSTFEQCNSKYLGGAVSAYSWYGTENIFTQCSSQIGGAIYVFNLQSYDIKHNAYEENTAFLVDNNFNKLPLELRIKDILEINNNHQNNTDLFVQVDEYLYPGLTYIIRLSIKVDGEWYDSFTNKINFGNLYELLVSPSNNFISSIPSQLLSINFPFLIYSPQEISFRSKQAIQLETIQIYFGQLYTVKQNQYKIYNGCKEQGMETVYLDNQKNLQFICKYCDNMKASYNGVCQSCSLDQFSMCYGDYSELKQSYWRSKYSVESQDIQYCSNNPQNCQGGSGIGNQLCFEGHIGAQCLNCDINGVFWNEKYSSVGVFQCFSIYRSSSFIYDTSIYLLYSSFSVTKYIFFEKEALQKEFICNSPHIYILIYYNTYYSLIDLNLECGNSSELQKIQNLSLVILTLCVIAFPIIVFTKLVQSSKMLKKVRVMFTFGFLYIEYKAKFFYWEIIRILVKSLLVLFSVSLNFEKLQSFHISISKQP
ncbi:hypothetical protein ABPG72_021202 [Tetrahymena utriculariae]